MTWRRVRTPMVIAAMVAVIVVVLPQSGLTGTAILGTCLFATAVAAAFWVGPESLFLALAALCLTATAIGNAPVATLRERDLANGLIPLVLPLAAAAIVRRPWAAVLIIAGGIVAGPVRLLVYDPFLDPSCAGCAPGELVVWPMPGLAGALQTVGIALALIAVLAAARRGPVELIGVLGCLAAYAADWDRLDAVLLGCLFASASLVRTALAAAHRRAQLERLITGLESGDRPPDPDLLSDLESLDDPVSSLVLESWRLTAELARRVDELRAARAGVVRVAAAERRSLERDLHDGVQQQLLALGLDLKFAAAGANATDHPVLTVALGEVMATLDEVRELTHGVYPPLLSSRGLAGALAYSARRHSSTATLDVDDGRVDPDVERAAFVLLDDALRRGASSVSTVTNDCLHLRAEGVDLPGVWVQDIVGAVGGSLVSDPNGVVGVIPCAS